MQPVLLCQHIKSNGQRCGCPALKDRKFCYFHDQSIRRRRANARVARRIADQQKTVDLPILEDANAVQVAIMQTIDALLDGRLNERRTGLLLYALQTASSNLKRTSFTATEAEVPEPWVTEILDALKALPTTEQDPEPRKIPWWQKQPKDQQPGLPVNAGRDEVATCR
jgi:hypothetical protein